MALVLADRIKETTTTAGTGTVTLGGAVTGYRSFADIGNGNTTYYCIAGQGTSEWEVGIGTYTLSGTTLARTTVLSNSLGTTALISFSAGTKDVYVPQPASKAVYQDASGNVGIGVTPTASAGILQVGTASYSDTGIIASFASTVAGYNQVILQNKDSGTGSSTNFNVSNNAGTSTTNFGEFGINSSGFTGSGSFSQAGYTYLASASTDLAIGTYGANAIHFVTNSGTTDAMTIGSTGLVGIGTSSPTTKLTISANTVLPSAGTISGTNLWQVGADTTTNAILLDSFGAGINNVIYGRRSFGTAASPSATNSGANLLALQGWGYGTTGYSAAARITIGLASSETWTDTAQGTYCFFNTTTTGTTTTAERMRLHASGGLSLGNTTDPGATNLSVTGTTSTAGLTSTGVTSVLDGTNFLIKNTADNTKVARFDLSGLTTGNNYTYVLPNTTGSALASLGNLAQTFTGQTTFSSTLSITTNATSGVNAATGGLTSVTAVAGSLTLATGGVTLASQVMTNGWVWRIRAYGTYVASSSATARTLTMSCFWGSTALTAVTTGNVLSAVAQTTPWQVELEISGSSTTAAWCTAVLMSQVTSATIPQQYVATAASVTGLTTTSTLDFRVGQTGTAVAGDTINVHSVTIERIK